MLSLSVMVPVALPSTMLISPLVSPDNAMARSSVPSIRLSSMMVTVTCCTSPLVPVKFRVPEAVAV